MPIDENIVTGKKFRVWDAVLNKWKRISYWTKASDVELNDGSNVESTLATMDTDISTLKSNKQDITDNNLATTNKTIVAAINEVNNGLSNKASWSLNSPTDTSLSSTIVSGNEKTATPVHWDGSIGFPYIFIDGVKHYLIRKADVRDSLNEYDYQVPLSAKQGYIMSRDIPWYGTSSTAASTIAKTATTSDTKFALTTGAKVSIKFTYNNTASAPTLNVDSTGAKSIKAYGTTAPTSWWQANDVVTFTYDGTNWIMQSSHGQFESYKTRPANTLLWEGSISDGEFLKFAINNFNEIKAISFMFRYAATNNTAVVILPIESWITTNLNIIFTIKGKIFYLNFVPTFASGSGANINIKHLEDLTSDSTVKLINVYGILK